MPPAHLEPYGRGDFYQDQDASLADLHPYYSELQSSDMGLGVGVGSTQSLVPFVAQGASLKFPATGVELNQVPFLSDKSGFNYSTIEQGGALTLSPNPYPTDIVAPLPFAAEDEATLLWSAAGLGNTSFHSADDTSETSPSTLLSAPYGYHSIHTNSHPGCSRFSGLSGSQTAFGTDNWPAEVGECSQSYPAANLVSVNSRPVWDANAHSSSSADPVNLWTAPLMNGDPDSNHAPIHGFQSMNDPNVNHDFAFGPMADTQDFTEPYLTPSLDYHVAGNINAQSTSGASNGTMFDTSLRYNPAPAIADELLSQNALRNMELEVVLPENNESFPQARARSPGEAISSEISPANHDDHERVMLADPNACVECSQSFANGWLLVEHCSNEVHAAFMCKCGKGYARLDVLGRHLKTYQLDLRKYTCPQCNSHGRGKSFKRKDHLTQHIRGYHHFGNSHDDDCLYLCPHSDCLQYREPNFCDLTKEIRLRDRPFAHSKEFMQHMRSVHNEAPYPCDVSGCLRARGKGYYRRTGLIKHRKREHPDAPKVKVLLSCRLPGCSSKGENGIINHYMKDHGYSLDFAEGLTNGWTG